MLELDEIIIYGVILAADIYLCYHGLKDSYKLCRVLERKTTSKKGTLEETLAQDVYD